MKTRDRILHEARRLFNEQGYGAVTTATLAAQCGIAEGNLWYHFKTKRALLDALGEDYAKAVEQRLALIPRGNAIGDYAHLLEAVMAEFRHFRFLYRDQPSYGDHAEIIARNAPVWLTRTFAQFEAHLRALVEAGLLDWPGDALPDLAINAAIILRYGLEHLRELGAPTGEGTGAVQRVLLRHLTQFEHALAPRAAEHLREAIARIEARDIAA